MGLKWETVGLQLFHIGIFINVDLLKILSGYICNNDVPQQLTQTAVPELLTFLHVTKCKSSVKIFGVLYVTLFRETTSFAE